MKKTLNAYASLFVTFVSLSFLYSCSDDISSDVTLEKQSIYDERNYEFNTINLWGSDAAVIDKGDYYLFQGDVRLYKCDSLKFQDIYTRGAGRIGRQWPNNKVYYSLSGVPADVVPYIYAAISWIEDGSYIEMCQRYNEKDYIQFSVNDQLASTAYSDFIGRKGGQQNIVLSSSYAKRIGSIVHEICHAVGMYHEMCRTDRDKYVKINFDGMSESERYQYKTYAELGESGINVGAFDFSSIMMYPSNGVMYKLNGDYIFAQRDSLSNTDMLTLAKLQPLGNDYMFYNPLGTDEPIYTDYELQNSKTLRCPEGANIDFKLQYSFDPSDSKYGSYSEKDFNIKAIVSIVNRKNNKEVFRKEVPLNKASSWIDVYINNINIPQGSFTTNLIVKGSINGVESAGKLNVLKQLMYFPHLFLHLNKVTIDGKSKNIPNDFGNDNRMLTFIEL